MKWLSFSKINITVVYKIRIIIILKKSSFVTENGI